MFKLVDGIARCCDGHSLNSHSPLLVLCVALDLGMKLRLRATTWDKWSHGLQSGTLVSVILLYQYHS